MVKTYADLYLDARKALLPIDGTYAANMAREILCAASGKTDRKSTRLNSSHTVISYAVFCLKKILFF